MIPNAMVVQAAVVFFQLYVHFVRSIMPFFTGKSTTSDLWIVCQFLEKKNPKEKVKNEVLCA